MDISKIQQFSDTRITRLDLAPYKIYILDRLQNRTIRKISNDKIHLDCNQQIKM